MAFQLLNMVEENTVNQVRRMREAAGGPDSEPGAWPNQLRLLRDARFGPADLERTLGSVHVQPVLTAHPTEAKRASVLERHREIYLMLVERENRTRSPMEQEALRRRIEGSLERLWRTGEVVESRPDVESEIRNTFITCRAFSPGCCRVLSERFRASWEWAFPGVEAAAGTTVDVRQLGRRGPRRPPVRNYGNYASCPRILARRGAWERSANNCWRWRAA